MTANRIDNAVPYAATHPLEVAREEMTARGMSQKEMAQKMGIKPSNLSRLFKERQKVTVPLAIKLENALPGIEADFWLRMQARYDKDTRDIAMREKKERRHKAGHTHVSLRIDSDLLPFVTAQANKNRFINNCIRAAMTRQ